MANFRALAGALLLFASLMVSAVAGETAPFRSVQVRGSTIFLPAMQMLAERYMAEHAGSRIIVLGGGSWLGIKSVLDKSASFGVVSGEGLPDDLSELMEDENLPLRRVPIARYGVVPIVHPGNPVTDLSVAQLRDIYAGRIRTWKEVGGPSQPIHIIASADAMAGIFQVWTAKVMGGTTPVTPSARTVLASEIGDEVARDPLAIGYTPLGRLAGSVKALKVGGVEGSAESIAAGRYGLTGDLSLAYLEPLSGSAKAFLDYCLGAAGREETQRVRGVFIGDRK